MTDQEGLLKAIHANPRENTPRLVYADWLDENAGMLVCPTCGGRTGFNHCPRCDGSGRVPDGRATSAAFIRDCPPLLHKRVRYGKWEWRYDRFGDGEFTSCYMPMIYHAEAMKVVPMRVREHWDAYTVRHGFVDVVTIHPDVLTDTQDVWERTLIDYPITKVLFTRRGWFSLQYCKAAWPGIEFAYAPGAV